MDFGQSRSSTTLLDDVELLIKTGDGNEWLVLNGRGSWLLERVPRYNIVKRKNILEVRRKTRSLYDFWDFWLTGFNVKKEGFILFKSLKEDAKIKLKLYQVHPTVNNQLSGKKGKEGVGPCQSRDTAYHYNRGTST